MRFIIPKFVLHEIDMPTRVVSEHENYYWLEAVERLQGFLLYKRLPYIALKFLPENCYAFNEDCIYTKSAFPTYYEEWAIEQTERYPKGKLLSVL